MTPLVLITGFLGAGKTTLLRGLVPRLADAGLVPHVVINDYQNAFVDAALLRELTRRVTPISGTCVCCGSRDELLDALKSLRCEAGSVLLVEANGTVDTVELIEMLSGDRRAAAFSLPAQIAVVDAKRWQKRHWNNALEAGQVRTAGHVVLTRRDEVGGERWTEVEAGVRAASPRAEIVDEDGACGRVLELARSGHALPPRRFDGGARAGRTGHEAHHFASMEWALPPRVSRAALEAFLRALPSEVLRAKGVAFLDADPPEAVLFQKVEEQIDFMKLGSPDGLEPVCILVGSHLPEAALDRARAALAAS